MKNGWILLHRKLQKEGYYNKPQYLALWIHLLLEANHTETEFLWNKKIQTVKRGQLLTGRKKLSDAIGVPTSTIEDILTFFENNQQQIQQQKTTKWRLITIPKYHQYQLPTANPTTEQQQSNNRATHTKNIKNVKKERALPFFSKNPPYQELLDTYTKKGFKSDKVKLEFTKFTDYWTEPDQRGTQRWQKEKVFEVGRRLRTWFSRVKC